MNKTGKYLFLWAACILAFFLASADGHDFQLAPRLPNGLTLEPAGRTFDVGNMPLSGVVAPDGQFVLLLSGFREQGVQVVDPESGQVKQTLSQPSAFIGLAFSSDGKTLYASGAGQNVIYMYDWMDGSARLKGTLALTEGAKPAHPSYPAGIALSRDNRYLFVAENVAGTFAVVDLTKGTVIGRKPAGEYPYAVAVGADGMVYVSDWGGDTITRFEMDSRTGKIRRSKSLRVGRHPSALLLNAKRNRLFVTCASVDTISVVDTRRFRLIQSISDAVPGTQEGSTPNALALSADESQLYVAEADNNSVAVFQLSSISSGLARGPQKDSLLGRIPAGWYPTAFLQLNGRLFVVNAKGRGTKANPGATHGGANLNTPTEYTLGQLNGTITELPGPLGKNQMDAYSTQVAELNSWKEHEGKETNLPFRHVLYIIKENRTYDQVFGDLPQGDGDPSLLFFPQSASPNHRALAERFGLFDRFFVNAEVSSQGHPWSTSAYVTDFTEKTVHSTYSDRREGEASDDDVSDPATGYLWDLATRGKVSCRIYGEYAELSPDKKTYRATKRGASATTSPTYPSYDLSILDQKRAGAWLEEFHEFVSKGEMPALQIFHLPGDHTAGARAGMRTPAAYFADNDLALGRMMDALSHSRFWKDTVVFVVEDDAQSGPDHVDSHRSVLLVISAYSQSKTWHRFVNTTDVMATIEHILGLDSLSQFDHFGRPLAEIFSDAPDLTPYQVLTPEQPLDEKNPDNKNAQSSLQLKLEKPDLSDDEMFNRILWTAIKGDNVPFPSEHRVSTLELQHGK